MKLNGKLILLIIFEAILFAWIIFLGLKIFNLNQRGVKGTGYISNIKDSITFSSDSAQLKFFYEPRANFIEQQNPAWLNREIEATLNSDTLNERFEYSFQKPIRTYRVITLGDSFTYGLFVNTDENYSEKLEDLLNDTIKCKSIDNFEVINLGVPGYDLEYMIERFVKRGIKYDSDIVIWLIIPWHFEQVNEYMVPLINNFVNRGIPGFDPVTRKHTAYEKAFSIMRQKLSDQEIINYQKQVLLRISNYKYKILILTFPNFPQKYRDIISDLIQKNPFFNYYSIPFDYWRNKEYQLADTHPNSKGHEMIAKDIFDFLLQNILKDCK